MDSTVERSFSPGIRDYGARRRSFSNRPIGCIAIIGCCVLVIGIGMVLWESRSRPKLELSNWYAIMRTLGTTFVSLGLFVFLASTVLMCETVLSERSNRHRTDEESSDLQDDLQTSRDYGTRWHSPKKEDSFLHRSVNETPERKARGMVRCVSDSHFFRRSHSRTRDHHWGSEEFRFDTKSAARTPPSSPTYSGKSAYNWASVYDRPVPTHKKAKHHKHRSRTRSKGVSASWTYSGDDYPDLEKLHKPRLRVSLSQEAIEDTSSNDSPDSGRPGSEFSVNRSNAELLTLLVEKGILNFEDFRQYFALSSPTGTQLEKEKDSLKDSKPIHRKEESSDIPIAGHSRPALSRQKNVAQIHRRSENREIPSQKSPPFSGSWDRNVPPRPLFTIGERIRTSSTSDWRTESDAGQLDSGIATSSANLPSQLSNSLPHLHSQIDFSKSYSETVVEDLRAFEGSSGASANLSENLHATHQQHSESNDFDVIRPTTAQNMLRFEQHEHVRVHVDLSQLEDASVIGESTEDRAPLITNEKHYHTNL